MTFLIGKNMALFFRNQIPKIQLSSNADLTKYRWSILKGSSVHWLETSHEKDLSNGQVCFGNEQEVVFVSDPNSSKRSLEINSFLECIAKERKCFRQ